MKSSFAGPVKQIMWCWVDFVKKKQVSFHIWYTDQTSFFSKWKENWNSATSWTQASHSIWFWSEANYSFITTAFMSTTAYALVRDFKLELKTKLAFLLWNVLNKKFLQLNVYCIEIRLNSMNETLKLTVQAQTCYPSAHWHIHFFYNSLRRIAWDLHLAPRLIAWWAPYIYQGNINVMDTYLTDI